MKFDWRRPSFAVVLLAQLAAVALLLAAGPLRLRLLFPSAARHEIYDLYQEWGSAKNYFAGMPVYAPHAESLPVHLNLHFKSLVIRYNAHPPPAVLLALPLGLLSYDAAFAVWSLLSLGLLALCFWLFCRELKLRPPAWLLLPILAGFSAYQPLTSQLQQGQLNAVLLVLLLGCWIAERRGHAAWAGGWLGLAVSIKFFPGFLFLYFLLRRQWTALAAGALAFAAANGAAWAVFGWSAYTDYVTMVLPDVREFRCYMTNASLDGWWGKLFAGSVRERVVPLLEAPLLARIGSLACAALTTLAAVWVVLKAKSRAELDFAFGVCLTAALLLSPLTWDHSLLLLTPWLWLTWRRLPATIIPCCLFLGILLSFSLNHVQLWRDLGLTLSGREALGLMGVPAYALAGLFVLQCWTALKRPDEPKA